jgi:uncharacterized protein YbcI
MPTGQTAAEDRQLGEVARCLIALHKDQFGRGPRRARAELAGDSTLVVTLERVLLPAEQQLCEIGDAARVRDSRTAFQVATSPKFIEVVERILGRKVTAFASGLDTDADTAFETFVLDGQR